MFKLCLNDINVFGGTFLPSSLYYCFKTVHMSISLTFGYLGKILFGLNYFCSLMNLNAELKSFSEYPALHITR